MHATNWLVQRPIVKHQHTKGGSDKRAKPNKRGWYLQSGAVQRRESRVVAVPDGNSAAGVEQLQNRHEAVRGRVMQGVLAELVAMARHETETVQ